MTPLAKPTENVTGQHDEFENVNMKTLKQRYTRAHLQSASDTSVARSAPAPLPTPEASPGGVSWAQSRARHRNTKLSKRIVELEKQLVAARSRAEDLSARLQSRPSATVVADPSVAEALAEAEESLDAVADLAAAIHAEVTSPNRRFKDIEGPVGELYSLFHDDEETES